MLYVIVVLIGVLGLPGPVVITVDEYKGSKLRFKTEESCKKHINENSFTLKSWSASLFPEGTSITGGLFDCQLTGESIPGLSVSSDTPSKKI
tara:strand:+ start:787 stop:1062 length:276 start_codon:yes stop_codon:yes gene_type:complete